MAAAEPENRHNETTKAVIPTVSGRMYALRHKPVRRYETALRDCHGRTARDALDAQQVMRHELHDAALPRLPAAAKASFVSGRTGTGGTRPALPRRADGNKPAQT